MHRFTLDMTYFSYTGNYLEDNQLALAKASETIFSSHSFIHLYLYRYLDICLFVYQFSSISTYLSVCLSIYSHQYRYLPFYPSIYLSICLPAQLSVYLYIRLPLSIFIYLYLSQYISLSALHLRHYERTGRHIPVSSRANSKAIRFFLPAPKGVRSCVEIRFPSLSADGCHLASARSALGLEQRTSGKCSGYWRSVS